MRNILGQFMKGHKKPVKAWSFPLGKSNPAKREDIRNKLREDKLGEKNPMFGKHHSKERKEELRKAFIGERNPQWKGGVTLQNELIRKLPEYKLWRKSVFTRDDYTCVWCGQHGGYLEADHIKPFCDYPELRFAIDNGRTLCKKCHHSIGWKGNQHRCE